MRKIPVLLVVLCFAGIGFLYAAPVDVPTKIQGLEGNILKNKESGIGLSIVEEADFLSERKLDITDSEDIAEVKGQFYTTKIILTVIDKFDFYGIFGKAENLEYEDNIKPKDKLTWGVGLSAPIYEWKNHGIKLFADGKYRTVNNIDYTSNYELPIPHHHGINHTLPKFLVDWQEWQVALGLAKHFGHFMPYLGVKYSDFRESSEVSSSYSDSIVGIFVGCAVTPMKAFSIDLQGRFIDERALTIKATYKF
ncbi:MAG: hypothetical protein PHS93_00970 [Candidatus Omnitrophica bacterium]|nr:hypothetical protein [Candidatus Omnitrophota bacterium]MDD5351725.1 hypothetical protein [Candidatus Omnitrophota bacterium]MDD5550935.1 hypothetical protein [Candidatus Omnitrophota bacterium]